MPNVKGIVPFNLSQFVLSRHGEEGLVRVCAALPAPAARMLRNPVAHDWYPHADFLAAEDQIVKLFYRGEISEAWRFGHFNMEESVNKVYRFLFKFLSPEVLISKSAKLWGTFMDTGTLEFEPLGKNAAAVKACKVAPANAIWCHEFRGALLGALAVCQTPEAQRSVVETHCVFNGDGLCRFEVRW